MYGGIQMTLLSILLSKKILSIKEVASNNFEYLEDYINYKLTPYKQLDYFRYNYLLPQHIDGINNPETLIYLSQKNIVSIPLTILSDTGLPSTFFNAITNTFSITNTEFLEIRNHPIDYCILFSNLFH